MTTKEKILFKHSQLAKEYYDLTNSNHLLSAKDWKAVNKRMNEILIEIQKLKDIESSWGEFQSQDDLNLSLGIKMLSVNEVCSILNTSRNQVTILREVGVINAIKTGKNYMFPLEEIQRFFRDYIGYDVSNKNKAIKAYEAVHG